MSFQQGLSGLNASSKSLDVIGNNIANSSTVGFKSGQAQFADVFAASLQGAGSLPAGLGVKLATVAQQFTQGNITATNNPLDIAINGGGFFRMSDAGGAVTYARNGQFQFDKNDFIVNAQGLRLMGFSAVNGIVQTGNPVALQLDRSDLPPQATGAGTAGAAGVVARLNLNSGEAIKPVANFVRTDPATYNQSASLAIYDSLGNPHTYTMYFLKTAANAWNVQASVTNPAGTTTTLTAPGAVTFDSAGALQTAMPLSQTIAAADLGTGAAALTFDVNLTDTTQFGGSFSINALSQDGFTIGKLSSFAVGKDGIVLGRYTNGQSRSLGQVILAAFANPQGLSAIGNNQWLPTSESGTELISTPGTGGDHGVLQSAAVEDSNVDLTQELVNLITAQRAYQANAQTIRTQDQVLQTLVNLR